MHHSTNTPSAPKVSYLMRTLRGASNDYRRFCHHVPLGGATEVSVFHHDRLAGRTVPQSISGGLEASANAMPADRG